MNSLPLLGPHLQKTVPSWQTAARSGMLLKATGGWEIFLQSRDTRNWVRHVDKQPMPTGNYEQAANDMFAKFVNPSQPYWQYVTYVQGWNEFYANSQDTTERQHWTLFDIACAKVWLHDWRDKHLVLRDVRFVNSEAAVGNDIPVEVAAASVQYNSIIGYHPYTPVSNGLIMPDNGTHPDGREINAWKFYDGRWEEMDKRWTAQGIYVDWIFGEGGAVRDASPWKGHLQANDGWRHPEAFNADVNLYINMFRRWLDKCVQTDAYKRGAVHGMTPFTTGGGKRWKWFETRQPELDAVADLSVNYPYPPLGTDPPDADCTEPRVQYRRLYHVYPPNATKAQRQYVFEQADLSRGTVGGSADDALYAGKIEDVTGIFYGLNESQKAEYRVWAERHYPCSKIQFANLPVIPPINGKKMGVDVSHHQGEIDWDTLAAWRGQNGERIQFAYIKFTDGRSFKDPKAHHNWDEALRVGITPGAFHYLRMKHSASEQVKNFLDHFGDRVAKMAHVCDVEDAYEQSGHTIQFNADTLLHWLIHVESKQQHRPTIYTAAWYWDDWVKTATPWADAYNLWVSSFDVPEPTMPADNWDTYLIWQFAQGNGRDFGVESTKIDLNWGRLSDMLL